MMLMILITHESLHCIVFFLITDRLTGHLCTQKTDNTDPDVNQCVTVRPRLKYI